MDIETKNITPTDLLELAPVGKLSHVGLRISKVLGYDAAHAWAEYRLHSQPDHPVLAAKFDPKLAREASEQFEAIAGFSPDEVIIEIYAKEKEQGFSTIRF